MDIPKFLSLSQYEFLNVQKNTSDLLSLTQAEYVIRFLLFLSCSDCSQSAEEAVRELNGKEFMGTR